MLQAFIIVLREGFEAFLIVAITLAYLRRTSRGELARAVHGGVFAGLAVSAGLGLLLHRGANVPLWEAVFGFVAFPLVVGLVIHMWREGPKMHRKIEERIEASATCPRGHTAAVGVFGFTTLMISREGMETVLLLLQVKSGELMAGVALGVLGAAGMAWLWLRAGYAIDLRRFFQVTGVFLLLFALQIGIGAFHELTEAGILANSVSLHVATEAFGPEGRYGKALSTVMVAVPAVWLAWAMAIERWRARGTQVSAG